MENEKLIMTFEANTIQHLGVKMYSTLPPALAELIANAYDACASEVHIRFYDDGTTKSVTIEDNGTGMSFDEVNNYFLRIGRNRRDEKQTSKCDRVPTGKKGLGKLALFGIGDIIEIETCNGEEIVKFILNWNEIVSWTGKDYTPYFQVIDAEGKKSGTKFILSDLKRKTGFPIEDYSENIARLFNFNNDFVVFLYLNDGIPIKIDNRLKYNNIDPEFEWNISDVIKINEQEYKDKLDIKGKIVTTEKPLKANLRGVTLFANGRMVNAPEFFGPSESSHFYSYATGWLDIDFIDNWQIDVISTNRQSIDWEDPLTNELREYLASCLSIIEKQWRERRSEKKKDEISKKTNINVTNWIETLSGEVKEQVDSLINILDSTPEISEETQQKSIEYLHKLVPEYPNLHWRHVHPEIQNVSEKYYEAKDYYTAFIEALKRYIAEVKKKSGVKDILDRNLMQAVFNGKLLVTKKYIVLGHSFDKHTIQNIEEGQKMLSEGIVVGGRNPLQHEEHLNLSRSGLFSEKDCLDYLSLLSHLFKRLDDAQLP